VPANDVALLGAVIALLGVPSLVLVRAPWPVAPCLGAALWIVSGAWMGILGGSRERLLQVALVGLAVLALLRLLPKQGTDAARYTPSRAPDAAERRRAGLAIALFALARMIPLALWPMPPGTDGGFRAAGALLTVWHDGPPWTLEPLYPVAGVGIDGAALLAADVQMLSGAKPERALLAVALAGEGLVALAAYAALTRLARLWPSAAAGLAALAAAAAAPWPGEWASAVLVAAFAIGAAAVLAAGSGRAAAVAAGVLGAASVLTDPLAAALALAGAFAIASLFGPPAPSGWRGLSGPRLLLASGVAACAALPALLRPPARTGEPWIATTAALLAIAAAVGAARLARPGGPRDGPSPGLRWTAPLLVGAALACVSTWTASRGRIVMDADRIHAWRATAEGRGLLDRFCLPRGREAHWVPAVTGRGTEPARWTDGTRPTPGAACVPPPP
jgi:hypothetical protein